MGCLPTLCRGVHTIVADRRHETQIKSKFTRGLVIFASLLLLQALDVIPDMLKFMALLVLMYLSSE